MFKKGQRFRKANTAGKQVEVIVRNTTKTLVTFDIMPYPYWWEEGGARFGLKMKQSEFSLWLGSLKDA